jgi:hypothetical protein
LAPRNLQSPRHAFGHLKQLVGKRNRRLHDFSITRVIPTAGGGQALGRCAPGIVAARNEHPVFSEVMTHEDPGVYMAPLSSRSLMKSR